ncbi:MAG: cell envelope integrity protein CreD [Paludibacteraceae bacterium]
METYSQKIEKISQSATLKAVIIGFLTLIMLIPGSMIQNLIQERQMRSNETTEKINSKWSNSQTINGPVLVIPYQTKNVDVKKNVIVENHTFNLTPENLNIYTKLIPEERHYGIYKSILYKSTLNITGNYKPADIKENMVMKWNEAYIRLGISDLRGINNNVNFTVNGEKFDAETGGSDDFIGQGLVIKLKSIKQFMESKKPIEFSSLIELKGSSDINFTPIGRTTNVEVSGNWKSPGFTGSFTPEYTLDKKGFVANWKILHFNRNIPDTWSDDFSTKPKNLNFGVNLVNTVDHYQLNMRSAKYALMFIALTFVAFFFVELLTKKKIHPIQYLLAGIALILFYSLLLSISEQLNFGWAYVIAAVSTISMIVIYAHFIFRNRTQTGILTFILVILYTYLYIILQLEDVALLIGSIGLFIILGIIMYLTNKIKWYKDAPDLLEENTNNKLDN